MTITQSVMEYWFFFLRDNVLSTQDFSVQHMVIFNLGRVATTKRQTGYSRSDRQLPHSAEEAGEGAGEIQCQPLRHQPQ